MAERSCLAVVLAAGEGTRMRSSMPKVLHGIGGESMLAHVLRAVAQAGAADCVVVIGPDHDAVAKEAGRAFPRAEIATQTQRLGTAHAVLAARSVLERGFDDILVVFADTPLVRAETLRRLRTALAAPHRVDALIGDDAIEPGGNVRAAVELTRHQGAMGLHVRFLHHVFRISDVSEHPSRQSDQSSARGVDDPLKSRRVSGTDTLDGFAKIVQWFSVVVSLAAV